MRSALAYRPLRGPLQEAGALAAIAFLGSFAVAAFAYSNPIVLAGAGVSVVLVAFAARARAALALALRYGAMLGLLVVLVNGIVAGRGETVLIRGWDVPVLGPLDVTLEALAEGGVLALRIAVVITAFAVYSACVDPDRVLRLLRPVARRSALTATLVSRLVPLAAADHARLREAAALRGPEAAPAGRAALARRLVEGSLDRALDAAATLELRGYALARGPARPAPRPRSRHDPAFLAAGVSVVAASIAARVTGAGGFEAYPSLAVDAGAATLALAAALPLLALAPFAVARERARG
jgi:energy-coupling factor transport system permease protein